MAGCVPCFIIPLLLFIFHRYIQPILLKFWNPWENSAVKENGEKEKCTFSCDCSWNKKKSVDGDKEETEKLVEKGLTDCNDTEKLKAS
ncbi:unnamed protein product [Acanthoscelides obtectus]|uniref:Uncharacterized protein n=1 Tax=Acanthoscelides obtectus TaxID=200917 RepID=A0A9P0LYJ4_ACAOB|nr:unnamed protein product [Acanthoscelides obtectus]CAK1665373.1 UPF0729 protein GD16342 [Acanthoscelides obtectus]